jgi:acyl-CoA thioester hydrolase
MTRHPPGRRADYRYFHAITTRWQDNDPLWHVNNVHYFAFFDTAVTYFELTRGIVDLQGGKVRCVVAEVACRYHSSVAFPDRLAVGLRVARMGRSSVRYEIGVFREQGEIAAAEGYFVHVFVDAATQRPVTIADDVRAKLGEIAI